MHILHTESKGFSLQRGFGGTEGRRVNTAKPSSLKKQMSQERLNVFIKILLEHLECCWI